MAMFIETKANENIRADANAAGDYITVTNGYVPDYLFEIGVSGSGTVINVTSGMIVQDGVKVVINAPERVDVGREASGTYEYKLYLKIKMNEPQNPEFVYMRSNITPQKDNVFSNMNAGINHIEIATFTRNTSGVAGLKKTLSKSVLKNQETEWVQLTAIPPFNAPIPIKVKRVGDVVFMQGAFERKSGFSGSLTKVFDIPAGFRPAYTYYVPAVLTGAATVYYNGRFTQNGEFSVIQTSQSSVFHAVVYSYVTEDPFPL